MWDSGYRTYVLYTLSERVLATLADVGWRVIHVIPATQRDPVLVVFRHFETRP